MKHWKQLPALSLGYLFKHGPTTVKVIQVDQLKRKVKDNTKLLHQEKLSKEATKVRETESIL